MVRRESFTFTHHQQASRNKMEERAERGVGQVGQRKRKREEKYTDVGRERSGRREMGREIIQVDLLADVPNLS